MLQVYTCITQYHDLRLVLLAAVICFLCAYTSYSVVGRAVEAGPRARIWWLGAGAVATGSGIWATHFVAILAYDQLCTFEFGIAVEIFGLPRPEFAHLDWYTHEVVGIEPGRYRALGGVTVDAVRHRVVRRELGRARKLANEVVGHVVREFGADAAL